MRSGRGCGGHNKGSGLYACAQRAAVNTDLACLPQVCCFAQLVAHSEFISTEQYVD
jgi:hypothetical protein